MDGLAGRVALAVVVLVPAYLLASLLVSALFLPSCDMVWSAGYLISKALGAPNYVEEVCRALRPVLVPGPEQLAVALLVLTAVLARRVLERLRTGQGELGSSLAR